MTWSRFDDGYDEHEKVQEAWHSVPAAVGLHVMATTACNRWLSDGVIRPRWLAATLPDRRARKRVLDVLLEVELFDVLPANETVVVYDSDDNEIVLGPYPEERYLVHDFLDRHDSSVMVKNRRRADAERKARSRSSKTGNVRSDSERTPAGIQAESARSPSASRAGARAGAPPHPDPTHTHNSTVAASGDGGGDVKAVWAAYVETRHQVLGPRSTPQFTKDRRALIARRLKDWPAADLVDAVRGWQHFPHNRGENDRSTPYCDLELVIKDAAHIERFRDKQRGTSSESLHDLAARANAAHGAAA